MQATTLKVTGMTCNHCVMSVTKALKQVPGVETADVSPDQGGQGRGLRRRPPGLRRPGDGRSGRRTERKSA